MNDFLSQQFAHLKFILPLDIIECLLMTVAWSLRFSEKK